MLHIIVSSNTVAMLLGQVFSEEQNAGLVEVRTSYPLSSLYGTAKTLLGVRNEPVAIILDANTTDSSVANDLRESAAEVIGDAAGAAPLKILIAVPAVEALLFEQSDAVKRAFPHASDTLIEIGKFSPATALSRLDPSGTGSSAPATVSVLKELNAEDIRAIRSMSPVQELLAFMVDLQKDATVASVGSA